jgi:hypothetical protein
VLSVIRCRRGDGGRSAELRTSACVSAEALSVERLGGEDGGTRDDCEYDAESSVHGERGVCIARASSSSG